MNRVTKRTWLMGLFIFVLIGGMIFFLWEYAVKADRWVVFTGSPHLYNNSNLGYGTVTDRNGDVLLDIRESRSYSENAATRKSTLHWLGDRTGYIQAAAVSNYAAAMAGYDPINGVYNSVGVSGVAELTISSQIQNTALEALNGRKGTVAVYNYKTGEILCAVTSPTFDPDNVPDITDDPMYEGIYLNRFIQSTYTPGSVFKLVTAAAALEHIPDIGERTFTCTGLREYGTEKVSCESAHGTVSFQGALASSCNCSFAEIAELIGRKNMEKYVEKFQVVQPVSFDGITTARGNYDTSETALVTFAWSCIGQHTDLINPARYMTFMGAIAGGGVAVEPYLVSKVTVEDSATYEAEKKKSERIMSEETADRLAYYMRNNVQTVYGDWNFQGMNVCAKSGTSQLGGEQTSNALFSGFVADEAYPLAFIVVVENGGYGAAACVPVLSKVLAECKSVLDAE